MFLVLFCSQKFDSCVSDGRTDRPTDIPLIKMWKRICILFYSILFAVLLKPSQPKPWSFVEKKNSKQMADVSLSKLKTRKNKNKWTLALGHGPSSSGKKKCVSRVGIRYIRMDFVITQWKSSSNENFLHSYRKIHGLVLYKIRGLSKALMASK